MSTGSDQVFLTAASRAVRRVPGGVAAAMPVVMADLRAALAAAGPVAAGVVVLFPGETR